MGHRSRLESEEYLKYGMRFESARFRHKYIMNNETFYNECAKILNAKHEYLPFKHYKRTRWNNRSPGSGRFEGRGIIRVFGDKVQIALNNPSAYNVCNSKQEALDWLNELLSDRTR